MNIKYIPILVLLGSICGCVISAPAKGDFPIYSQGNFAQSHSNQGWYQHAAVSSDTEKCSEIGRDILQKGGSAVDAGIAALFCNGVMDQPHMGLGGGNVMLIYESPKSGGPKEMVAIDADVRIPNWFKTFEASDFVDHPERNVLVPGEVAGYKWAWERYGRLPWSDLVQPSIKLAKEGWNATRVFAQVSDDDWNGKISKKEGLKFFRKMDPVQNKEVPYSQGDLMIDPGLANTLELISMEGGATFYNGTLSHLLVQDMKEYSIPITQHDLQSLQVRPKETVRTSLKNGEYFLNAVGSPFYGNVFVFIVNVMEAFDMTKAELATEQGITLFYHRYMEAWKFAPTTKTCIGDTYQRVDGCAEIQEKLLSKEFAKKVAAQMYDDRVLNENDYDLFALSSSNVDDHGTSHLSIITSDGSALSATSTVAMTFGSEIKGTKTGIVFNSRMLTFNKDKNIKTAFDVIPGSTGYSCRCPVIVTDKDGNVVLVLGSSGGVRIVHASAMTLILHVLYDLNLQEAIDYPKVAQFGVKMYPNSEFMHEFQDKKILENLIGLGQHLRLFDAGIIKKLYIAVTQGVSRKLCDCEGLHCKKYCVEAVGDFRKGGIPAGY